MIVNIEDLRKHAHRRLPRAVFDYVDGGAEDEYTMRANRLGFEKYNFHARALVDVSARDQSTTLLGEKLTTPVILGPTGLAGLVAPRGEILAARAAAKKGSIFTLSTMSVCSIEEVASAVPAPAPLWFQLYVWKDRGISKALIERAQAAGYRALCLTVDVADMGRRERDIRNGFTIPLRVTPSNVLDTLMHLGWVFQMLRVPRPTFGNFVGTGTVEKEDAISVASFTSKQFDPSVSWADLAWVRSIWKGPLLLKGISCAADARLAVEHGVEGVIVSNHGGRQLDFLPSAIDLLPEIVDAVEGRTELILDGGIRRGSDVVKAIALGARACMVGRPFLYGLATKGEAGVELMFDLLRTEIDRTLSLIGRPKLRDLDRSALRYDTRLLPPPAGEDVKHLTTRSVA
ncbi:alpha-hydroxy acid oxidase [Archangium sp.]|uniref:alpha-hydroxy acid oxidase n=1 Tax=Archangium sp. TaxID=1872627 RepID=UPI002D3CD2A1|nr:alpha-hydroxy acid oxidase [Archangium sp.]HYO51310.1 alpha-hydroxy acid oxidase [Archangium sp.]